MMLTDAQLARVSLLRPPHGVYVSGADNLRIQSFNAAAGVVLTIAGRFLTLEGDVVPFERTHTPNTDRTVATTRERLGEGWLLSLVVVASSGTPVFGQTFVRVELNRSMGTNDTPLAVVAQGLVTATVRLAWPGQDQHRPLERPGALRSVAGTDPAANTEISETVPTAARWRPLSILLPFTTDATVANREVVLLLDDGTNVYARIPSKNAQPASTTWRHTYFAAASRWDGSVDAALVISLPDVQMPAGHRVRTLTSAIQVGDNYAAPQLLIEEWLEP